MPRPLNLIVLGTAGAGKSTLVGTFGKWIGRNTDEKVAYVNLDPGCDFVPFKPDFDVRDYFTISKIMHDEKLGPNGAMVRASELLEKKSKLLSNRINGIKSDIRLIDTPGQMEVFLFHGGPEITKLVKGTTVSLFLTDAELAAKPSGFVLARLLGLATGLRLGVPAIGVLNKVDLVKGKMKTIDRMLADAGFLENGIPKESSGLSADLALEISEVLSKLLPAARLVKTSAGTGDGMRELYDIVHEVFCTCGDLT